MSGQSCVPSDPGALLLCNKHDELDSLCHGKADSDTPHYKGIVTKGMDLSGVVVVLSTMSALSRNGQSRLNGSKLTFRKEENIENKLQKIILRFRPEMSFLCTDG
eukprot:2736725-Amphidinium_carterae.1